MTRRSTAIDYVAFQTATERRTGIRLLTGAPARHIAAVAAGAPTRIAQSLLGRCDMRHVFATEVSDGKIWIISRRGRILRSRLKLAACRLQSWCGSYSK